VKDCARLCKIVQDCAKLWTTMKTVKDCERLWKTVSEEVFVSCAILWTEAVWSKMSMLWIWLSYCRFRCLYFDFLDFLGDILIYLSDDSDYNSIWHVKKIKYFYESLIDYGGQHIFFFEDQDEIVLFHSKNWIMKYSNVNHFGKISRSLIPINT
jgi:hypothetical protein